MFDVECPYCNKKAEHVKGNRIYPHRPDLYDRSFYLCEDCEAYVGCHVETGQPFGTPAKAELRSTRSMCHRQFDKLWKERKVKRRQAYKMLAEYLGIEMDNCHIGMFDMAQCRRVLKFVFDFNQGKI